MKISRRWFHRLLAMGSSALLLQRATQQLGWAQHDAAPSLQPLVAEVQRLMLALESVGTPLAPEEGAALHAAFRAPAEEGVAQIAAVLDVHVLLEARINPEGRVSVTRGRAKAELVEDGWRSFLVKVSNESGATAPFKMYSAQAEPMGRESAEAITGVRDVTNGAVDEIEAQSRWLALDNWSKPPLNEALSGFGVEYRLLLLYSREPGKREASLEAVLAEHEQDLGYRSSLAILFDCLPSIKLSLRILDVDGQPTSASLLITDKQNRVYPAQNKRVPPDLWFERHVYRADGESIVLPAGEYTLVYGRGPEYLYKQQPLSVSGATSKVVLLQLERWVDTKRLGYYSGDTHIHAAGCSHYESPAEGVTPEVMSRQVKGEALDVGDVLTWGPGYYYQKQFFSGHVQRQAAGDATLRYDVEVSGFPSSHCGHLVLLQLKEQDYPGAVRLEDWPSWNVPILKWAKSQGALTGYAHAGHGLNVDSTLLPNYLIPPFDSMGANEYLIDVTHPGLIDFISGCDTRPFAELNIWYHTLNCGLRAAFVGETDFPCLSDERVGGGRTYIQLEAAPFGDEGYAAWIAGIVFGNSYAGDGRSHLFHFAIRADAGEPGKSGREVHLVRPGMVRVSASVCARLEAQTDERTERIRRASLYDKPYWHLERARIGSSRKVTVELIMNGLPIERQEIEADGSLQDLHFAVSVEQSSWLALRILPSSHTNPISVLVDGKSIRASRRSAAWCRAGVDVCWDQKSKRIRPQEMAQAAAAYGHARDVYDRVVTECLST